SVSQNTGVRSRPKPRVVRYSARSLVPANSAEKNLSSFPSPQNHATVAPAKPDQRTRRKRMAARSGQRGYIERKGNYWYVRFRLDMPGQSERKYAAVRLCPVSGLGALSKIERQRIALEILAKAGANSDKRFQEVEAESCGITFQEQSEAWLRQLSTRK